MAVQRLGSLKTCNTEATPENLEALKLKRAVITDPGGGGAYLKIPPPRYAPGDLVLVYAGNNRDNVSYLGRIQSAWFDFAYYSEKAYRSDPEYRYDVERPDGSMEQRVSEHWFASTKDPTQTLENMITWRERQIADAQRFVEKLRQGLEWVKADDTGWFSRDYQKKPPKKAKTAKGGPHATQAETQGAPEAS